MISAAMWDRYKAIVNKTAQSFNKAKILWIKGVDTVERFNEEEVDSGDRVELEVLIGYNSFRTWPITKQDNSGELDNQNMLVYINLKYLSDLGLLTNLGYFNFKPDKDYFIYQGIRYKCEGHTPISQASDIPLHIILIMHREEVLTGSERFNEQTTQKVIQELETDKAYIVSYDLQQI